MVMPTSIRLLPHQNRVVLEQAELDSKIAALSNFFESSIFQAIDNEERTRLLRQHNAMKLYSGILGERIAAF